MMDDPAGISYSITKPSFIVNEARVRKNIAKMLEKAGKSEAELTPHFKTHQNVEVGEIYRELGVTRITVSSIDMAMLFADAGWNDILIAFPVNIRQIDDISQLASRIRLHLLVESAETIEFLEDYLTSKVDIMIKVDVGYHRTGLPGTSKDKEIVDLAKLVTRSDHLEFEGLYTHAGHSYSPNIEIKREIFVNTKKIMMTLKQKLVQEGIESMLSYGDTPSCSAFDDFSEYDYLSPGNFVYYDYTQYAFGSCDSDDIAVILACPVVAIHEDRIVVHGGGVHFSKDRVSRGGIEYWGILAGHNTDRWWSVDEKQYLASISQDHGIVKIEDRELFDRIKLGDLLYFYPIHSCMAADLMKNHTIIVNE